MMGYLTDSVLVLLAVTLTSCGGGYGGGGTGLATCGVHPVKPG